MEENSENLELFRLYKTQIIKALTIDISWLAGELERVGLISISDRDLATDLKNTANVEEKSRQMVDTLERKISLHHSNLLKLVRILKQKPAKYQEVINYLSPHSQCK